MSEQTVQTTIEQEIREFLTLNFPLGAEGYSLATEESLLEAGVIDSTGVLELIEFVESRYELTIPDEDVLPQNLDSVGNVTRYVAMRLEPGQHGAG